MTIYLVIEHYDNGELYDNTHWERQLVACAKKQKAKDYITEINLNEDIEYEENEWFEGNPSDCHYNPQCERMLYRNTFSTYKEMYWYTIRKMEVLE